MLGVFVDHMLRSGGARPTQQGTHSSTYTGAPVLDLTAVRDGALRCGRDHGESVAAQ
jgi:hypothetical protein